VRLRRNCACATWHGYIEGDAASLVPAAEAMEGEMLEGAWWSGCRRLGTRRRCTVAIDPTSSLLDLSGKAALVTGAVLEL
jgi:hypothetical protein